MERTTIQNYINNFRTHISRFLKENVGLKTIVYPYHNGAVLIFEPGVNMPNNDEYKKEVSTINDALMKTNLFEKESYYIAEIKSLGPSFDISKYINDHIYMFGDNVINSKIEITQRRFGIRMDLFESGKRCKGFHTLFK